MTLVYQTHVYYSPPTPLGVIGGTWSVHHWCKRCHAEVPSDHLIAHAKDHGLDQLTDDDALDRDADRGHHHQPIKGVTSPRTT